jgi:hydroxymethylglutaryl-CoA lyase
MGLANVLAAIDAGADRFDASLGGLGGCPYAPGATRQRVQRQMPQIVGHEVPGQVAKAGRITDLHPAPAAVEELRRSLNP